MNKEKLVEYITKKYQCHTIILYGSFANGTFDEESDIDVVGFTDNDMEHQDKSLFDGRALDLWIYNDKKLKHPEEFLHIRTGQSLLDSNHQSDEFLTQINALFNKGPEQLTQEAKDNHILWLEKMLKRTLKNDIEGQYRFHWALTDILPIYFEITNQWYLGSKESFIWLEKNNLEAFILFKKLYSESSVGVLKETIDYMKRKIELENVLEDLTK